MSDRCRRRISCKYLVFATILARFRYGGRLGLAVEWCGNGMVTGRRSSVGLFYRVVADGFIAERRHGDARGRSGVPQRSG